MFFLGAADSIARHMNTPPFGLVVPSREVNLEAGFMG